MNILDAIILGIVEGITEYLPVSSTGHLIITSALLGLDETLEQKRQVDAFNIMIQGGAILAVVGVFWSRIKQMLRGVLGRDRAGLRLAINLGIAFIPAAIVGVLLNEWIEKHLFYAGPVAAALFLGGVALIIIGRWQRKHFTERVDLNDQDAPVYVDIEHLSWKQALFIGVVQCFALWPGTSRSMSTIIGGLLVGMRPKQAAEFSFLLGVPTLTGACVYKGYKNIVLDDENIFQALGYTEVIAGFVMAMIAAAVAVRWLISYLQRHNFSIFGWYRIALAIVLLGLIYGGHLRVEPPQAAADGPLPESEDLVTSIAESPDVEVAGSGFTH